MRLQKLEVEINSPSGSDAFSDRGFGHDCFRLAMAFSQSSFRRRSNLRLEVGAQGTGAADHGGAERQSHRFEPGERPEGVERSGGELISQLGSIPRRLGDAHADVRAGDERRITNDSHASNCHARRF